MRRAVRVLVQVLLVLALLATVPATGGGVAHAVPGTPNVIPCEKPFAEYLVVGQYRSFGNTTSPEVRLGIPTSGRLKGRLSGTQIAWAPGANAVSFSYVPATDRLWFTVSNVFGSFSGSYSNVSTFLVGLGHSLGIANLNALQIAIANRDIGTTVNVRNTTIDWAPLDADQSTPLVNDDFLASPGPALNRWTVSGLDFSGGFTIRADIELGGVFGANADLSNVTFKLGHLAPSAAPTIVASGGAAVEDAGQPVPLRIGVRGTVLQPITVDYETSDLSAIAPADYAETSGTLTIDPCDTPAQTINVAVVDDGVTEGAERFGFTLSNATGAAIAEPYAEGTVTDDLDPIGIRLSDGEIREGDGGRRYARFVITLNHAIATPVAFEFAVTGGTAGVLSDFENAGPRTFVIPAGVTVVNHQMVIRGDVQVEADETIVATLSNAVGASIHDATGVFTIRDDDSPTAGSARAFVSDMTVVEGDSGTRTAQLTVGLSRAAADVSTVSYTTVAGTATAGVDFRPISGTLTFGKNVVSKLVQVHLLPDTVSEGNETFDLQLTGVTGPTLLSADPTGTVTIVDDDLAGAPTALVATAGTTLGAVDLTWTAPASTGGQPITDYEFRRSTDGGTIFSAWISTASTATAATDAACGAATSCLYQVRAVTSAGPSDASAPATALGADVPGAPSGLAAAPGASSGAVNLSWTAPASTGGQPITGYEFRRSTDGGTNFGAWTATGSTSAAFVDTGCGASVSCTYEVRAATVIGTGAASGQATALGGDVPGAPSALGATSGSSLGAVDLAWTAPASTGGSPITSYEFRRSTDGGTNFGAWTTTGSTSTAFVDTGCGASVSCTYEVRAVTALGAGAASGQASALGGDLPGTPTGLAAATGDALGEVDLSWTAPAGGVPVVDYDYRRSTDGGSSFGLWTSTGSALTAFTDVGCGAGTSCTYEVRAVSAVSEGAGSGQATASGANVAGAPTGLAAVTGDVLGEVDLSWGAPASTGGQPITTYEFRRSTDGGTNFGAWTTTGSTSTAFVDTGCGAGVSCTYEVRAVTVVGNGAASGQATASGADVPGAPTTLVAVTGSTTGSVDLTWTAPASTGGQPITTYEYRVSTDGGTNFGAWTTTGSTTAAFTDPACGASVSCTYEVRAVTVVGAGAASNQSTATGAP
ncbi:MAG TPA: Calx-beta domain-containing protein [Acidimicrobiia bacterium]|nr:Calx-beta domain-containing protein [Acidimicrobiia bacterium]